MTTVDAIDNAWTLHGVGIAVQERVESSICIGVESGNFHDKRPNKPIYVVARGKPKREKEQPEETKLTRPVDY